MEGETDVFSFSSASIQSLEFNSRKICLHLTNLKIWNKRDKVWSSANSLFKWLFCSRVELRHVSYEIWLDSYPFFSFQIWYSRKWIFAIIGQGKHMRVTSFNPLWVSVPANKALKMYYFYIRDINVAISLFSKISKRVCFHLLLNRFLSWSVLMKRSTGDRERSFFPLN